MTEDSADTMAALAPHAGKWVLGIDGGGTKTEARVAQIGDNGDLITKGSAKSGSSNLRAVGAEAALGNLANAIDAAASVGGAPANFDAAVIAAAGAGSEAVVETILQWSHGRGLAQRCEVVHDGRAVLAAAFGAGPGVAMIVGTGSAAMALDRTGNTTVVGGWGYWFGDEGSGYAIGRAGLAAASRSEDGRGRPTKLVAEALQHFGVGALREIPTVLGTSPDARRHIAAFAPVVSLLAEQGDVCSLELIQSAAKELGELYRSVTANLDEELKQVVALAGGAGCGSATLRRALGAQIAPTEIVLVPHPVEGCLKLAAAGFCDP